MDWWEAGLRLFLAAAVGCVIGVERERKNRPAGMRTHVLVCVGAALMIWDQFRAKPEDGTAVESGSKH